MIAGMSVPVLPAGLPGASGQTGNRSCESARAVYFIPVALKNV
jgi:hypothetical protein